MDLFPVTAVAEPKSIRLRDRELPFLLKRSQHRRSIVLTVDEHGLTVSAPWRSSERRIVGVIREAEDWVFKKLDLWSRYPVRRQTWDEGDRISYLGRQLRLKLVADKRTGAALVEDEACLRLGVADPSNRTAVEAAVVKWYKRIAPVDFAARLERCAPQLGVAVPRLFVSPARTRWGSCSAEGDIRLAWRLVQAPPEVVDYVVIHELAHLLEMNHSRRFWKLVAGVCPHYRDCCKHLDRMGPYYMDI